MIPLFVRRLVAIAIISGLCLVGQAQPAPSSEPETSKVAKPYRILTSGKQVTIKSSKEIKAVMVWTASGHRIIEEKAINSTSFSFNINVTEKVFFVMIQYEGSKPFTEKLGVE